MVNEYKESESSGHNREAARMNSWQLGQVPHQIPAWRGKVGTKSHPSQELLATESCWEKKYSLRVLPLMNETTKREDTIGWVRKGECV